MQANNNASGDAMWRRFIGSNGYQYLDVPVGNPNGPSLIGVESRGKVTFVDTMADNVYQMQIPVVSNNTRDASNQNQYQCQYQNQYQHQTAQRLGNNVSVRRAFPRREYDENADSGILPGGIIPISIDTIQALSMNATPGAYGDRFTSSWSRWTKDNVREGLRIIPANNMQRMQEPVTPTKFDADPQFNDALYMSLQGDIRPKGANPVDDYLNNHADARLQLYKEVVLGKQDCHCQCERTDLDKYLHRHKDVSSAISLRATLSDEFRHRLQEPQNTKPVKDKLEILKAQATDILKWVSEYSGSASPGQQNPLNGKNEDDALLIS